MSESTDVEELLSDLIELDEIKDRERRVLKRLLDEKLDTKGKALALKSFMGNARADNERRSSIPSYIVSHSLRWIAESMSMGSEMPLMQKAVKIINKKRVLVINEGNAHHVKQRMPDYTRQPQLAAYLAHDRYRKFAPILAVVSPAWVDDPQSEYWGSDERALKDAVNFDALDSEGCIGLLDLRSTEIYALDGQHRVMGIRAIKEFIDKGKIPYMTKDGTPKKDKVLTREEFLTTFRIGDSELAHLLNEHMHVEYIPAVLAGETRTEAARRVRSVFVAINSYAKRPAKGEVNLLDESNGFAIIARDAATLHPLFKSVVGDLQRVNWKTTSISKKQPFVTTLDTLKEMATRYLSGVNPDRSDAWIPQFGADMVPLRPDEEELEQAYAEFSQFLDHLAALPIFRRIDAGSDIVSLREFPGSLEDEGGHLLLRPLGQIIVAEAVGALIQKQVITLEEAFEKLALLDKSGAFQAHRPETLWYGVTYDPASRTIKAKNRGWATQILQYLLAGSASGVNTEKLTGFVVAERRAGEGRWKSFTGKEEEIRLGDIHLPPPVKKHH